MELQLFWYEWITIKFVLQTKRTKKRPHLFPQRAKRNCVNYYANVCIECALLLLQYKISQFDPLSVRPREFLGDDQALQESDVGLIVNESMRNPSARVGAKSIYEGVGKMAKIFLIVCDGIWVFQARDVIILRKESRLAYTLLIGVRDSQDVHQSLLVSSVEWIIRDLFFTRIYSYCLSRSRRR